MWHRMSTPTPRSEGPGHRRRPRKASRRAVTWTATGAAGLVLAGGIAGTVSGAFGDGSDAVPAAGTSAVSPAATKLTVPAAAQPSSSGTARHKQARKEKRKTSKPHPRASRTPVPRTSRHRPAAPAPSRPKAPANGRAGSYAAQIVTLANKERARSGCGALTPNPLLERAAQGHSDDMARRNFFDHTNPDGQGPGDRITATGYSWFTYGENIAMGQPTPESVMQAWMNSPGHRANILNCRFAEIGVGVVTSGGPYWTQVFGSTR